MRGRFGADPTVARKTATETAKRMKRNAGTKTLHDHTADIGATENGNRTAGSR